MDVVNQTAIGAQTTAKIRVHDRTFQRRDLKDCVNSIPTLLNPNYRHSFQRARIPLTTVARLLVCKIPNGSIVNVEKRSLRISEMVQPPASLDSPLDTPYASTTSPEQAVMLERYRALHNQQQNIRRTLPKSASNFPAQEEVMPSVNGTAGRESILTTSSPMVQPELDSPASTGLEDLPQAVLEFAEMVSTNTSASEDSTTGPAFSTDVVHTDDKLCVLNREIKSTLTDLLNCEATRSDSRLRFWVQTKLMETELELKRQRRRRTGGGSLNYGTGGNTGRSFSI